MGASGSHKRSKPGARHARAAPAPRRSRTRAHSINLPVVAVVVVPALILFGLVFAFGHWYFFLAGYALLLVAAFLLNARSARRPR
jgi:hypothetical protein